MSDNYFDKEQIYCFLALNKSVEEHKSICKRSGNRKHDKFIEKSVSDKQKEKKSFRNMSETFFTERQP